MGLIQRLFGAGSGDAMCPRCERAMEGHDDAECSRKMSRRFFFGVCAGAAKELVIPGPSLKTVTIASIYPNQITVGSLLYRIPIQQYRGGAFRQFNPDGGDLGSGGSVIQSLRTFLKESFNSPDPELES